MPTYTVQKPFTYATRRYKAGDSIELTMPWSKIFSGLGRVKPAAAMKSVSSKNEKEDKPKPNQSPQYKTRRLKAEDDT
jgi:hypothetical protein